MEMEIILLTGAVEAPHLERMLKDAAPALTVTHVLDLPTLEAACLGPRNAPTRKRLIAFCTDIIVPARVLGACGGPSYNFHPAPPEYPGTRPASFAVYEGARAYGATVHVMEEAVDSGAIVAVTRFDIKQGAKPEDLEAESYISLFGLFGALAPQLADVATPLPERDETWSDRKYTRAEFENMCKLPPGLDAAERERRIRAFGATA